MASRAPALDPARPINQYAYTTWNAPYGRINAITQSTDGYLWIGTESGLIRFDGQGFQHQDPGEFILDSILGLAPDGKGGLWVRSLDPSLLRYQKGKFSASRPIARHDPHVTAIGTGRGGAMLFSSKWDGLLKFENGSFHAKVASAELPFSPVTSIAEAPSGDLWVGTVDSAAVLFHEGKAVPIVGRLPSRRVTALLASIDGRIYIATDRGLARANGTTLTQEGIPQTLKDLAITTMLRDRDENIWIGSERGLTRLGPKGGVSFRSGRPVTALFEDREGDLWAGSADQMERIRETPFATYHSATHDKGGPVFADARGDVWFSSGRGVIERVHNSTSTEFRLPALQKDQIYSIAGDADELWLGLESHGLGRFTVRNEVPELKTYPQASPVYVVFRSRDRSVWLGTIGGGAIHFQNGQFKTYGSADGLASNAIFSISESPNGTIWFGTPSGLSSFSKNHWRAYRAQDGLPSENIYSTFIDHSGLLWVGTLNGLAYIRDGKAFPAQSALRGAIFGVAEDHLGSLWVVTSEAVSRVDLPHSIIREFGLSEGLGDTHAVRRSPTISADPSGTIWISRAGGVASIDPERVHKTASPTIVHVSHFFVDGNPHDVLNSPDLRSDTKRIAIQYEGLNLASPERIRYRFRLDGFDHEWNNSESSREAVHTNLGPGNYTFHVLASNEDQNWNGTEASVSFTVVPALWQTAQFQLLCGAIIIVLAVVAHRLRLHETTERVKLKFEARFAERNQIARDLHDTLLQSFQGLLLRFQAVEDMLPESPDEAKQSLEIAIERAARAITEGRDAVQELRREDAGVALADTLTSLGEQLGLTGDPASPSYRVLFEGTPRKLHPRLQDDLYRISREAVANALRHAHATRIELDLRYGSRMLRLNVRDDGVGMDENVLAQGGRDGHWGLPGIRERASAMKAELEIWTERNRGTELELRVPANIAYMRAEKLEETRLKGSIE